MSEQPLEALPPAPGSGGPLPWYQVWVKALTQPSENTFTELLARDPDASMGKAFGWIALSTLIGGAVVLITSLFFNLIPLGFGFREDFLPTLGGAAIALICALPVFIIVGVIGFALYAALIQLFGRVLGGTGTYGELTYAFAAYLAPLSLVSLGLSWIPFLGPCVSSLLGIYGLVLNVMAVKAVHRFDWGRAILTSLSLVILSILVGCCLAVLLSALVAAAAPALEEMFPEILRQLEFGTF